MNYRNLLAGGGARGLCAIAVAAILMALPQAAAQHKVAARETFVIAGDHFELNGKPFEVISGEMHYTRVPRAYWRARLRMAKAMGLNTVATYIFWNAHEPRPGVYDFTGNNDVAAFVRMAGEEGLHVLLRVGPYSCAEWEMGGFPSWLLTDPKMSTALRTDDAAFMVPVERWLQRLAKEIAPLQLGRGGPVIALQVENEYGNFDNNRAYMQHMRDIFLRAGLTDAMLYTVDPSKSLAKGAIDGVFAGVNFGTGGAERGLTAQAALRPGQPLFVTEYWPGWFDHWGHPHETRPIDKQVADLNYIFAHHGSVNIYMFHGGTSFGFMAGASWTNNEYSPDVTSYDYDAPLDEAGHPTAKFYAYRETIAKYAKAPLPSVPAPPPVVAVAPFPLSASSSLWEHLPQAKLSDEPLTMEAMGQAYGYVLYRKTLTADADGPLVIADVHDYAQVYVDGKLAGTIDRRLKQDRVDVHAKAGARLDILVENSGRVNSTRMMREEWKGIAHGVTLAGAALTGWENYSLPMDDAGTMKPSRVVSLESSGPRYVFAHFTLKKTGDTFLDVSQLGKGALWINGHAIGRYWNEGPQKTLFVPGPWLRVGRNEVVALEVFAWPHPVATLEGKTEPILNAPTPYGRPNTEAAAPKVATVSAPQ